MYKLKVSMVKDKRFQYLEKSPLICNDANSVAQVARKFYNSNLFLREETIALLFNNNLSVIGHVSLGVGTINACTVDLKLLWATALEVRATYIILIHNHPSGTLTPSKADDELTKKTKSQGDLLEIEVLDHIIVTKNNHYSYADQGNI